MIAFTDDYEAQCPRCKYQDGADGFGDKTHDEGEHKVQCPHCGNEFLIITCIIVSYVSKPVKGGAQ